MTSKVNALAFSADGSYFVTAGLRHIKFWYLNVGANKRAGSVSFISWILRENWFFFIAPLVNQLLIYFFLPWIVVEHTRFGWTLRNTGRTSRQQLCRCCLQSGWAVYLCNHLQRHPLCVLRRTNHGKVDRPPRPGSILYQPRRTMRHLCMYRWLHQVLMRLL